jgi:hypothetical protein
MHLFLFILRKFRNKYIIFLRSFDILGTNALIFFVPSIAEVRIYSFFFASIQKKLKLCFVFIVFVLHVQNLGLSFHFVLANFFDTLVRLSFDLESVGTNEQHLDLYEQKEQVPLLEVPTLQRPELYMDMSTPQGPLQHIDVSPRHRGLSCTWTCLDKRNCFAPGHFCNTETCSAL